MKKIKYTLKEVGPKIYAVIIKDRYDLCMTFLRVQEYYESPFKQFRNKSFCIWDYIKYYSSKKDTCFTYPADWSGFNVPYNTALKGATSSHIQTPYDELMLKILIKLKGKCEYIIGASDTKGDTFKHEVCHEIYYINEKYRKEMDKLTDSLPKKDYATLKKNLLRQGYCSKVIKDEIQAYMCFGYSEGDFSNGLYYDDMKKYHEQ